MVDKPAARRVSTSSGSSLRVMGTSTAAWGSAGRYPVGGRCASMRWRSSSSVQFILPGFPRSCRFPRSWHESPGQPTLPHGALSPPGQPSKIGLSRRRTWHEILQPVRRHGGPAHPGRRQPPALRLRRLPHRALPEPAYRRRQPAGVGRPGPALPSRHCAAPGLLDAAGRLHGERRDSPRRRPARQRKKPTRGSATCSSIPFSTCRTSARSTCSSAPSCSTWISPPAMKAWRCGFSTKRRFPGRSWLFRPSAVP